MPVWPITKMGLVINFVERRVYGFVDVVRIDRIDATSVSFRADDNRLAGTIDRVTGHVSASRIVAENIITPDTKDTFLRYEMVCKVVKSLF
jgi:hypothetical protein